VAHASGLTGNVAVAGMGTLTAGMRAWTLDYTAEALQTTDFADQPWRTYTPGLKGWSGTFDLIWDTGNALIPGAAAGTITLTANTGDTYVGPVLITGQSTSVAVDGVNTQTFTFQGSGALVITL